MPTTAAAQPGTGNRRPDRRTRHREQTRSEILDHALQIMAEDGAAGLTMARLARAMDIRPPSLYKYYPSLLAVYDGLFRRGQRANLQALRDGMRDAEPGLDAVVAGWRPPPGGPSPTRPWPSCCSGGPCPDTSPQPRRSPPRGRSSTCSAARWQTPPPAARSTPTPPPTRDGTAVDHALRGHQPAPGQRRRPRLGPWPVHPPPPGNPHPVHHGLSAPDITAVSAIGTRPCWPRASRSSGCRRSNETSGAA